MPATDHAATYGPPNPYTKRSGAVSCTCGWTWKRGPNDTGGAMSIWEKHARKARARQQIEETQEATYWRWLDEEMRAGRA